MYVEVKNANFFIRVIEFIEKYFILKKSKENKYNYLSLQLNKEHLYSGRHLV